MTATSAATSTRERTGRGRGPGLILYVAILFVSMSVWRFQELWPIIGKLQISFIIEIALVAAFFADSSPARRIKWAQSPIFLIPFLLLGIMVVGLPLSLYPGLGLVVIEKDFFPTLFLFLVIATCVRDSRDMEWFAFAHLIGAVIYSFWVYLFIPVGSNGRLGGLVYYDANDFGVLLVCTIPFTVYFLRPGVVAWKRLFALFALVLFILMIMKSGSRGGFLGFVAVMLFILLWYRAVPKRLRIGAVAGGAFLLLAVGSTTYWNLMSSIAHPKDDYNLTSDVGRKAVWKRGIGYMLSHPVVGVGVGAFAQAEAKLSDVSKRYAESNRGLKWSTAHNSFVLAGAELGVGGLLLFVAMIIGTMRGLWRIRHGERGSPLVTPADEAYAQMLIASLIGYCVAAFFVSGTYFSYLYVIIGLAVAVQAVIRRRAAATPPTEVSQPLRATPRPERGPRAVRPHWSPAS